MSFITCRPVHLEFGRTPRSTKTLVVSCRYYQFPKYPLDYRAIVRPYCFWFRNYILQSKEPGVYVSHIWIGLVRIGCLGPPVAVGFCGGRMPSRHVFHTSRQAMIKTYKTSRRQGQPGYGFAPKIHAVLLQKWTINLTLCSHTNKINPGYTFAGLENITNTHVSAYFRQSLGGIFDIHRHINSMVLC